MPTFTQQWFDAHIPVWNIVLQGFKDQPASFLEIGCFEGRATLWLLENILTHPEATIAVIDTFTGSDEHAPQGISTKGLFEIFSANIQPFQEKVIIQTGISQRVLRRINPEPFFDFIYVDGSHQSTDVLEDAVLSWRLLKSNGIMIFDDYRWWYLNQATGEIIEPRVGIDSFLNTFANQFTLIANSDQIIIQKK